MLVITRNTGQEVAMTVAGITITIILVEIRESGARIGIQAPREVVIHRDDAKVKRFGDCSNQHQKGI